MVELVEPRRPFIDGKYVPGDGPVLAVENPATEETIAEVETASMMQIEQAIGAARRSFDDGVWSGMPAPERAAVVRRMAEYLADATRPACRHRDRGSGRTVRERDHDPGRRRARPRASDPRSLPRARAAGVQPDPADGTHARGQRRGEHERVRAGRCRQRDLGVQLPLLPERVEDAARVDGRLLGRAAAEPAHAAVCDVVRRGGRRRRAAARRAQRRDRPGDRGRQADHDASRRSTWSHSPVRRRSGARSWRRPRRR